MNTQSITNFYNSKFDIRLDNSEYYDVELCGNINDLDFELLNYNIPITYESLIYSTEVTGIMNFSDLIRRRTENGWTLDFVFNRNNLDWSLGSMFYYLGISGSTEPMAYADNNLTFEFTDDKRLLWTKIHYSGTCNPSSGYTESFYTLTGQTPSLCVDDATKDFNITISFKRYIELIGCDLENNGGINDLITGSTLTNEVIAVVEGEEPIYTHEEVLNEKWFNERFYRLGVLKIYLNGVRIYKEDEWEEIIPSNRLNGSYVQLVGGGIDVVSGDVLMSQFAIKNVKYYEEPLGFLNIKHNFHFTKSTYDIETCEFVC